jgi:septal ring factor EnvC (AmiA/AmiB activator)
MRHTVTESADSSLDFDRIRAEIDSLDSEVREDTSKRQDAHAVIARLGENEQRLSQLARRWRSQPANVTLESLDMIQRVLSAIYDILEYDVPRFSPLWTDYRAVRRNIDDLYDRAMDALSVFGEVMDAYERQQTRSNSTVGEVATSATQMSIYRRKVIEAVRDFGEMVAALVEELDKR